MSSPTLWLITQETPFWHQKSTHDSVLRFPPVQDKETVAVLRDGMKINDVFLGLDSISRRVHCVGILFTGAFPVQGGWTIELLVRHVMENEFLFREPHQVSRELNPQVTFYRRRGSVISVQVDVLQELFINEKGYWEMYESVIDLLQWQRSEARLEEITQLFLDRGMSDEESEEVLAILRSMIHHIGGSPERAEEINHSITRIMILMHAEELPSDEWNQLWERLISAWRSHLASLAHR